MQYIIIYFSEVRWAEWQAEGLKLTGQVLINLYDFGTKPYVLCQLMFWRMIMIS